ncbi:glycosyltransferase family 2 protein [Kordiimonas aestuarii]|uniref:glycosyltransferase family 2 protein n=1 Tax=Kordiimonas aestuarii TaxID=1005925 RepID=UPI0021D29128|nr:glycosyltransferase family 2 protein [Kordiimonas aestuarii]
MKLIIQIPCFNEEETLAETLADLPTSIEGIDTIEVLIVDDGSVDRTQEVARAAGVHHIIVHSHNKGLARAFATGIEASLRLGADIIVNTDADNQYNGGDIPALVRPILDERADIVVGDRQTANIAHFSPFKKLLQRLGSRVVRALSGTDIPDAVSGFRAFRRKAAMRLNIVSSYSYTVETLIQAGMKKMKVCSVPVRTKKVERPSRLFTSMRGFIQAQLTTMMRMYAMFKPLRFFFFLGALFSLIGILPILRFLYYYVADGGAGHIQSLVLGVAFLIIGMFTLLIALLADLIGRNRQLIEQTLERVRRLELDKYDK